MSRHEMDDQLFRLCKADLRLYPSRKRRYEWLRKRLATLDKSNDGVARRPEGTASRPTETAVMLKLDGDELQELEAYMSMMDAYFSLLSKDEYDVIRLTFVEEKNWSAVIDELHIHERKYYRLLEAAIMRYAIMSGIGYAYERDKKRHKSVQQM